LNNLIIIKGKNSISLNIILIIKGYMANGITEEYHIQ